MASQDIHSYRVLFTNIVRGDMTYGHGSTIECTEEEAKAHGSSLAMIEEAAPVPDDPEPEEETAPDE